MKRVFVVVLLASLLISQRTFARAAEPIADVQSIVAHAVRPVMGRYGIAGMAAGVTVDGRHIVFNYGVASKSTGKRIDASTLFEIGSISKTFTATLVSYAALTGRLSLTKVASAYIPQLRDTAFDQIHLVNLGTHTAGGLPLQFPDDVRTDDDALAYYRRWKPSHPAGTYRLYSNPSIMLLGLIAATSFNMPFATAMQREVLAPLGLHNTFLDVPADQQSRYAQGYASSGQPRRMSPGPLAAEAYGIRTTAADVLRFLDANMKLLDLDSSLRAAIVDTHTGYYRVGAMTQDMIWEQYSYPAPLSELLQGNSDRVIFEANPVGKIDPPLPAQTRVLINKTGSTSGFSAYVAFVPKEKIGIVLLANTSYPIAARVRAAYRILTRLTEKSNAHPNLRR